MMTLVTAPIRRKTIKLKSMFMPNAFNIVAIEGLKIELFDAHILHCLCAIHAPINRHIKEPMKNGR